MGIQKKLLFGYGCFVLLPILVVCGFFLQRMVSSTLSYTDMPYLFVKSSVALNLS